MSKNSNFWYQEKSIFAWILTPLSRIYNYCRKKLCKSTISEKFLPKIICIGNITVGGAGKTPACIALYKLLQSTCDSIYFLSRGYKGSLIGPINVRPNFHTANQVGDEPLLLAKVGNTIVSKNRAAGARLAQNEKAKIIIMDDGFQNNSIFKDLSFLVIDGSIGFGNQMLLPAGPLRHPITEGLSIADAIIIIGNPSLKLQKELHQFSKPIFKAFTKISRPSNLNTSKIIAFAGIAFPEKFKNSLISEKLQIQEFYPFSDHHTFTENEISKLKKRALTLNLPLLTTEKDFVRLTHSQRKDIIPIPLHLKWENSPALEMFLESKLCSF